MKVRAGIIVWCLCLTFSTAIKAEVNASPAKSWRDGTQYFGDLIAGKREGAGRIIWEDGTMFVGTFENDQRHGEGSLTLPDGTKFTADFKRDVIQDDSIVQIANADVPQVQEFLGEMNLQLKAEIESKVKGWQSSWANQSLTQYLSFYSSDFTPEFGKSLNSWRQGRALRVRRPETISLELSNIVVKIECDSQATVRFQQHYKSDLFEDRMVKELTFQRELSGWKIVREAPVSG